MQSHLSQMHDFLTLDELEGLESDMSKVRTYQLSAHQRLRFKVHTQAGDYCNELHFLSVD